MPRRSRRSQQPETRERAPWSASDDPTLDLHGLYVDAALKRVHAFLLAEQARGTVTVRIITGHGTGAVKQAVRDLLRGHPAVTSWQPALRQDAVTVVVLRPPSGAPSSSVIRSRR